MVLVLQAISHNSTFWGIFKTQESTEFNQRHMEIILCTSKGLLHTRHETRYFLYISLLIFTAIYVADSIILIL